MKKIRGVISLIVIVLSITFVSAATSVYVDPASKTVGSGEEFSIDVKITTTESIWAGSFILKFDPSFIQAYLSSEGDFLKQGGSSTYPIIGINNITGEIKYDSTRFGSSSGATGTGTLFTVNFRAIASSGSSSLNVTKAQLLKYPDLSEITASTTEGTLTFNRPPSASSLVLSPSLPKTNNNLQASYVYSDPDGDLESGTEIRWYKNNVLQSAYNNLKTVPSSATTKGAEWYFTVKPKDGKVFGTLQTSLKVTIQNSAPTINWYEPSTLVATIRAGIAFLFDHTSNDADGDGLTYSWELNGVEKATTMSWSYNPQNSECGLNKVEIEVSDGSAFDLQEWDITVLLRGDVNGDNNVNIFDLAAVGLCYGGGASGSCEDADLNSDGSINIFDLATVGLDYGEAC